MRDTFSGRMLISSVIVMLNLEQIVLPTQLLFFIHNSNSVSLVLHSQVTGHDFIKQFDGIVKWNKMQHIFVVLKAGSWVKINVLPVYIRHMIFIHPFGPSLSYYCSFK